MSRFLRKYSTGIIVGFGLLVFGLTQTGWLTGSSLWQKANGALIDRRYLLRGQRPPDPQIALVGLGSSALQLDALSTNEIAASPTLQLMQRPWPWDRRVYAAVLDKLMDAGAGVVMFDFVFASEDAGDDEFARALAKYRGRVVIGEMLQDEQGPEGATKKLIAPNKRLLPSGTEPIAGLVNQWADPDGVIRAIKYRTSLEHESGLDALGYPEDLAHLTALAAKKYTGRDVAPADDHLRYIDFQGPAGTYRAWPVEEMFVDKLWRADFGGGSVFSNKVVIVGPMAEIFHDDHATPFGDMPGPELQAQILAALLRGSWLSPSPPWLDVVLTLALLGLGLLICLRVANALFKVTLLVAVAVAFLVVCQVAFTQGRVVLPLLRPLFCLAVPGAFGIVFQFALEQFERIRTRSLLERYVSKNVARTILEDQRSFIESLRGRKQSVTVLFSDIRGFTSLTENTDAENLVAQLNEYFLEMVGVVLQEGGTLQKFIGDAIMAAWGDTHSAGLAEDARRALSAALGMRGALARLNERWTGQPGRAELKIGVGINHGEIIVGNIGHPQRMEFTVLGDGVNLASRLESATKQFHTDILVGESAEALTRDWFIYRTVDLLTVKGKTRPVEVFALVGGRSQPPPPWLAVYQDAIKLYRGRRFTEAAARFDAARREIGAGDFLCEMYLGRCRAFLQQPPPADWDGSHALTEK